MAGHAPIQLRDLVEYAAAGAPPTHAPTAVRPGVATITPDAPDKARRIAQVRDAVAELDAEWLDYQLDLHAWFLSKPQLRNLTDPIIKAYRDAEADLRDRAAALTEHSTGTQITAAETAARTALKAWGTANSHALAIGVSTSAPPKRPPCIPCTAWSASSTTAPPQSHVASTHYGHHQNHEQTHHRAVRPGRHRHTARHRIRIPPARHHQVPRNPAVMRVQRGRRLRPVPELGHYETHVGALNATHIGRSIAVHTGEAVVAGRLHSVYESALMGKARLVLTIWCGGTVGDSNSDYTRRTP